ncbi:MAG: PEGA domain-containing protein, partial [Polyangiaceae bacterium]|nr:PEGA domain-containing protein [Polyangiaceae bacterium]
MRTNRLRRFAISARLLVVATTWLSGRAVLASDLADEADLHFKLGNESVAAGNYRQALAHYLLSNRLAPNTNVTFNIAKIYESLGQYPDAYRYYVQVRAQETDPGAQTQLDADIARILPLIAVIHVTSEPPGATVYVNRTDLGPRGQTPQTLAFVPGDYRILVAAPGYRDAISAPIHAEAGITSQVALTLERILGHVELVGSSSGLMVRVDREDVGPVALPAKLALPAGEHVLFVSGALFDTQAVRVVVKAGESVAVRADPPRKRGRLFVLSPRRGAAVMVDGQHRAFVPAVLELPAGRRRVTVSQEGFRSQVFEVDIAPQSQRQLDVELVPLERVVAASRHDEGIEDAPGSVSLVPAWELRAMQYPTVLSALRGVRGVFVGDDRTYGHVGIRGFARPGDYGNRLVVLLDGNPLNDNYLGSSYVGFDGRTDLDDLDRIEVVRG